MGVSGYSQDTLTVTDFTSLKKRVLEDNIGLKAARLRADESEALVGSAFSFDKTEGYYGYDESNRANNEALSVLGVRQNFAFPTVYFARKRVHKAQSRQQQSAYEIQKLQLEQETARMYYQIQYEKARIGVYYQLDSLYQKFAYAAQRRFELGESNYLEKITARAKQKQLETQLLQAKRDLAASIEKLKPLLKTDTGIQVKTIPLEKISLDNVGVGAHPALDYYENRSAVFDAEASLEKQQLLPDFSLTYFQWDNNVIDSPLQGYQIGVHIPLLFFGNASKIKAADLGKKAAMAEAEDFKLRLNAEYRQWMEQLKKHREALSYYENEGKSLSEEIIKMATLSYKSGEIDFFEYIQSLENSYGIILSYYENLNAYNQTVIRINYITL